MADAWDQFPDPPKNNSGDPWSDFPDHTLSWGDVPGQAISNLPQSAYNMAAGIANTVLHPIDTASNIYDVGKGAVSKAAGAVGISQDPKAKAEREAGLDAVVQFFHDRYGGMEELKKTMATDPAGFAMDLSTVLSGGGSLAARLPGVAGKAGGAVRTAGDLANPVTLAGKTVSGIPIPKTGLKVGVEPVLSHLTGMTTGVGEGPIRQAGRAGLEGNRAFRENMRGNVPLTDTVEMAQRAVGQMGNERSAAYRTGMAGVNADKTQLSFSPLMPAIADARKMVNFNGIAKSEDAANTLQKINAKVDEWLAAPPANRVDPKTGQVTQYFPHRTAEGFDALKQALGEIQQSTQPGTLSRRVADRVYHSVKETIVKQAPSYADTMKEYATASDKLKELTKTFSLGEKASTDTTLRKLQSTQRNNVQTNYGHRNALLDELAKYEPDLPFALAGQSLNAALPRGLAGKIGAFATIGNGGVAMHGLPALMNPATLATLPAFSPRIVGEAAYAGGRLGNAVAPVATALPGTAKAGYVTNVLAGGMGPRYDENGNRIQ